MHEFVQHIGMPPEYNLPVQGESFENWERRCFLWVKKKRDSLGLPSLVLGTTSFLGTCWALANLF